MLRTLTGLAFAGLALVVFASPSQAQGYGYGPEYDLPCRGYPGGYCPEPIYGPACPYEGYYPGQFANPYPTNCPDRIPANVPQYPISRGGSPSPVGGACPHCQGPANLQPAPGNRPYSQPNGGGLYVGQPNLPLQPVPQVGGNPGSPPAPAPYPQTNPGLGNGPNYPNQFGQTPNLLPNPANPQESSVPPPPGPVPPSTNSN